MSEKLPAGKLPFESLSMEDVARLLQIHPSEVIRILVQIKAFPTSLLVDPSLLDTLRRVSGIESWWGDGEPSAPGVALAQQGLKHMLEKSCIEPDSTRADNLFRGLPESCSQWLRRFANALIREGILFTRMGHLGLMVGIRKQQLAQVQDFVVHGEGPIQNLCSQLPHPGAGIESGGT